MKHRKLLLLSLASTVLIAGATLASAAAAGSVFDTFVTARKDRLVEGDREFRFVSVNMPDSVQLISNYRFEGDQPESRYRWPDEFELRDCVETVRQLGGRVIRTFVITCHRGAHPNYAFDVSGDTVVPNEEALRSLDKLLQICNEKGVRLIIPLVAYNSRVRGDVTTYGEEFFQVGSTANLRFKNMLSQLFARRNTFTGTTYRDDKAILAWQTGNELVIGDAPDRRAWLHDIAAEIKSLDRNHLLIDGRNKPNDVFKKYDEYLEDPNIDVMSYHTYVNLPEADTPAGTLKVIRGEMRGKKALIVSEVAMYTKPEALRALLEEIEADGTVGANWWAVRFHNRDGGFYKHSDRGSQFEDLNWPGFETQRVQLPEIARERELLGILREHATRISGLPALAEQVPEAPHFLPAADVGHLSWQGSTGASSYQIQRSSGAGGPWTTLEEAYTDNLVVYAPLFSDRTAKLGETYFYRVIARNRAGASQPSNIVGPIRAQRLWWIDDLFDLSLSDPSSRNATVEAAYAHDVYLEDIGVGLRKDPSQSASFIYRVPGAIRHFSVFVHQTDVAPRFYLGAAAAAEEVMPKVSSFNKGRRARYDFDAAAGNEAVLEIRLAADASPKQAISRVEIAFE